MRKILDIGLTAFFPAGALVVLVLSARGSFRGAATFPPIFAGVVVAVGLLSLFLRRRRAERWHSGLVVLGMLLALGAAAAHYGYLGRQRRAAEEAGLAALAGGAAPEIPYGHVVNAPPDAASPLGFGGGWTLVNFWATWCDPCRAEMPVLERFWREHREEGLRVVGVTRLWGGEDGESVGREVGEIGRFLAAVGVTYPVVVSDEATVEAYRVVSWPTTVLVGPDGRAVGYGVGIDGAEELLARARRSLQGG